LHVASLALSTDGSGRTGSWADEEQAAFVAGLDICGCKWLDLHMHIKTRTPLQIKHTHTQKFRHGVNKEHEDAIARGDVVAEQEARRLLAIRSYIL
jgi:hypothetical protein